jgi:hypothetical protein
MASISNLFFRVLGGSAFKPIDDDVYHPFIRRLLGKKVAFCTLGVTGVKMCSGLVKPRGVEFSDPLFYEGAYSSADAINQDVFARLIGLTNCGAVAVGFAGGTSYMKECPRDLVKRSGSEAYDLLQSQTSPIQVLPKEELQNDIAYRVLNHPTVACSVVCQAEKSYLRAIERALKDLRLRQVRVQSVSLCLLNLLLADPRVNQDVIPVVVDHSCLTQVRLHKDGSWLIARHRQGLLKLGAIPDTATVEDLAKQFAEKTCLAASTVSTSYNLASVLKTAPIIAFEIEGVKPEVLEFFAMSLC